MLLSCLPEQLRAFPSLRVLLCSSTGDMGGPDSHSRALPALGQSLVFLLWLLCHGRFNYNPFRHTVLAYLTCSCMLASSSLAASPPGTSCCQIGFGTSARGDKGPSAGWKPQGQHRDGKWDPLLGSPAWGAALAHQ